MIHVDPDWWKNLFDELYLVTDARSVCDDSITCREVDALQEFLGLEPDHEVLDLCGGHGRHSLELSRRGYTRVTVFDYSSKLLRVGKETAVRERLAVDFCQGDARRTGFDADRFDAVLILGNSFGYFIGEKDEEDDLALLKKSRCVLKPGGILGMDITDGDFLEKNFKPESEHRIGEDILVQRFRERDDRIVRVREKVFSNKRGLIRDQTYASRLYNSRTLASILNAAGFKNIHLQTGFSCHQRDEKTDFGFMTNRILARAEK